MSNLKIKVAPTGKGNGELEYVLFDARTGEQFVRGGWAQVAELKRAVERQALREAMTMPAPVVRQ